MAPCTSLVVPRRKVSSPIRAARAPSSPRVVCSRCGNVVVGDFLVEYFANTPAQYHAYFREDHERHRRVTATMLVTGRILADPEGAVAALVREAARWHRRALPRLPKADAAVA